MTPQDLYALIYSIAPDMHLTQAELEELLCGADEITDIGMDDLHALTYKLAEKGFLDDASLSNYLDIADRIARSRR